MNKITIFDVANMFLNYESMSNGKLQYLCYYAQAWHLGLNKKLLIDCRFEAWIHGPICPELFYKYKHNGNDLIGKLDIIPNNVKGYPKDFIKSIYDTYGELTEDELRLLTQNEFPWQNARGELKEWKSSRIRISEEDMISYYNVK